MNRMTGDEFVQRIEALQRVHNLTDGEIVSALLGIVITLCRRNGENPQEMMRWAVSQSLT
jgi:hypothetical protein